MAAVGKETPDHSHFWAVVSYIAKASASCRCLRRHPHGCGDCGCPGSAREWRRCSFSIFFHLIWFMEGEGTFPHSFFAERPSHRLLSPATGPANPGSGLAPSSSLSKRARTAATSTPLCHGRPRSPPRRRRHPLVSAVESKSRPKANLPLAARVGWVRLWKLKVTKTTVI